MRVNRLNSSVLFLKKLGGFAARHRAVGIMLIIQGNFNTSQGPASK